MVATYKVEVKNGQVRRKPGRAKGVKEVGPRLPAGARAKIKQVEREQARNLRLAALKRRKVQEALGGEDLPAGTSVNDLTPLEASELALQRQGMRQQAEQLLQQLAEQRAATTEIARLRAELSTAIPSCTPCDTKKGPATRSSKARHAKTKRHGVCFKLASIVAQISQKNSGRAQKSQQTSSPGRRRIKIIASWSTYTQSRWRRASCGAQGCHGRRRARQPGSRPTDDSFSSALTARPCEPSARLL
jgi:hypothetical protein